MFDAQMSDKKSLVKQTVALLRKRGKKSLEIARHSIEQDEIKHQPLRDALRYFADEMFPHIGHPGLLSVYCEAVGGDPDKTTQIGAAMVMLVSAADIHDDLIDESKVKNGKRTLFGKYGKDLAVLAGDAFLMKGMYLLEDAMLKFSIDKRNRVLGLIKQAFFDLSSAEAEEVAQRGNIDLSGPLFFELIKGKSAVSEATGRIGAVLADGTERDVQNLGEIGYIVGLLGTMRDEFIDVFEPHELNNRFVGEILPLPVLYVFQDSAKKNRILELLKEGMLTKKKTEEIVRIVMEAKEIEILKAEMFLLIEQGLASLTTLSGAKEPLRLLLESTTEDLR